MSSVSQPFLPYPALFYFVISAVLAFLLIKKSKPNFSTLDLIYIGIGGAIAAIGDHFIGDLIYLPQGIYPVVNPPVWFRMFLLFVTIALVRKVGSGMMAAAVFDIIGDLLHFGFKGEPLWLIEDILTYGLFLDIGIYISKGKIFGIGVEKGGLFISLIEGGILGLAFAIVHPIFTFSLIAPIVFGFVPNVQEVEYLLATYIIGDSAIGTILAIFAKRIGELV